MTFGLDSAPELSAAKPVLSPQKKPVPKLSFCFDTGFKTGCCVLVINNSSYMRFKIYISPAFAFFNMAYTEKIKAIPTKKKGAPTTMARLFMALNPPVS